MDYGNAKYRYCWTYRSLFLCFGLHRSRVGKYQKQTWKRVAYISIRMAEYWKIQGDELQDLAMCALLHDNALTQYISEELKKDSVIDLKKIYLRKNESPLYIW